MARQRRASRGKLINPTFFVFCEGKTEEAYINFLKRYFRLPSVHVHCRVSGNNITREYMDRYKADKPEHEKDRDFLMYDLDAPGMLHRLQTIPNAVLLLSNPCIELWFLLHFKQQRAACDTTFCERELFKRCKTYRKGQFNHKLEQKLRDALSQAVIRAKQLPAYENPSSTAYLLIEALEAVRIGGAHSL